MANDNLSALVSCFDLEEEHVEDEEESNEDELLTALLSANRQSEVSSSAPLPANPPSSVKTPVTSKTAPAADSLGVFDPVFGIRIKNPKVCLESVNRYCHDMKKIKASTLHKTNIPKHEWATMAVIVGKSTMRKSANDKEFVIWQVSDLTDTQISTIKVLLFGDCAQLHWKLQVGMTVIIANAGLADSDSGITLKVSKAAQIVEVGFCPDFGICKALKQDGNKCTLFVNLSKSDYCVYHVQSAAKKLAARRGTFGSTSSIPPKSWRMKEPAPESIPGLQTVNRNAGRRFVKPVPRHSKLSKTLPTTGNVGDKKEIPANATADELLRNRSGVKRRDSFDPMQSAASPMGAPQIKRAKSMKEFISSQKDRPNLGSRAQLGFVDLASPEKKMKSRTEINEQMKIKRAAEILKKSQNSSSQPVKRSICGDITNSAKASDSSKSQSSSFSDVEIMALLNKKSKFEGEALVAIQHRQNKYFADREVEERVETNATTLSEIKNCKVVSCQSCDYTSVHQSDYCKSLGHIVRRHLADKRFFKCKNCKTRVSCFKLMPTKPCQSCLMLNYERVAMRDERKVEEEKLLLRGEERKFI